LRQPAQVQAAFAVIVTSQVRLITALNLEIAPLGQVVATILAVTGTLRSMPAKPASA
jgi:hypothetical protein